MKNDSDFICRLRAGKLCEAFYARNRDFPDKRITPTFFTQFFFLIPEFFCDFLEIMLAIVPFILYNDSAWALARDISKPHTRGSAAPVSERAGCRDDRGGGKTKGEIVKWLSYL